MPYQSIYRPGLFAGQVVVVTGAGSGIGRCTAHELASLGAHVALVGRTPEKLQAVQAEIVQDGGRASAHPCDIRDELQVGATIDAVLRDHGRVDGLVNNAGGQYRSPMEAISTRGFEAVVRNNLTGTFIFMREAYTRRMKEHGGAIVNVIADIWFGWPDFAHSGASRGGVLTMSQTAACEWATSGVRINCVAPGGVASSGFDRYPPEQQAKILEFPKHVPLQRYGTEAEVSGAIVYLLSPAAAYVTGDCIRVDGGTVNNKTPYWTIARTSRNRPFDGFHRAEQPELLTRGSTGG